MIQDRPILRTKIWNRLHRKDKNWMGAVLGDTGEGKSEFALRLCELIDPNFDAEKQVVFTIEGFMDEVNKRREPGSAILFDEVGVALSHATHYDEDQIKLNHVLETWREQNRMLVMTAPHLGLIQKSSRGLLHGKMEMWGINFDHWLSEARYTNLDTDTNDGSIYEQYPRLKHPETGNRRKYRFLKLFKPSPDVVDPYLERKIAFNDQLNSEVLAQVAANAEDGDADMSPTDIAEQILENGREAMYVSIHGGRNEAYFDKDLIRAEWGISHNDANAVKKLLRRESDPEVVAE